MFDAIEHDARAVVQGLTQERGAWRAGAESWSVAECFDHLASINGVYLGKMEGPATAALASGRTRRGPATPGLIGGWFIRSLEPPVKKYTRTRAPASVRPRTALPL